MGEVDNHLDVVLSPLVVLAVLCNPQHSSLLCLKPILKSLLISQWVPQLIEQFVGKLPFCQNFVADRSRL